MKNKIATLTLALLTMAAIGMSMPRTASAGDSKTCCCKSCATCCGESCACASGSCASDACKDCCK